MVKRAAAGIAAVCLLAVLWPRAWAGEIQTAELSDAGKTAMAAVDGSEIQLPDEPVQIYPAYGRTGDAAWCLDEAGHLTVTGSGAFRADPGLLERFAREIRSVDVCGGITSLEAGAFRNCICLSRIGLPGGITAVCRNAFDGCTALADVYYSGSQRESETIRVDAGNSALTAARWHVIRTVLELPEETESVGAGALAGTAAEMIILPAGVRSVAAGAFAACRNLRVLCFRGDPAEIADDILAENGAVIIQAAPESAAARWAEAHGMMLEYRSGTSG